MALSLESKDKIENNTSYPADFIAEGSRSNTRMVLHITLFPRWYLKKLPTKMWFQKWIGIGQNGPKKCQSVSEME